MTASWLITNLIAAFLLPPLNGLVPAVLGLLLRKRWPRLGRTLLALGLVLVTAFSMPIVASHLLRPLEQRYDPLPRARAADLPVDAIVILGGGRYRGAPEFDGQDDIKGITLDRLRYGALLARESGKPVLVTGGSPSGPGRTEGDLMKASLARDFGVAVRWVEDRSENTRQNALFSAQILLPQGARRIALVTHAFHMPRAVSAFEAAGFEVVPAPTAYLAGPEGGAPFDFLPSYDVMYRSGLALHEVIGLVWYRLRG